MHGAPSHSGQQRSTRKHLYYLSNGAMHAWAWNGVELQPGPVFRNDEEGWAAFNTHVEGEKGLPACVLVDLIEEDFQRETMPHVFGTSRRNMLARRLGQLYRDTPFRRATLQGREPDGRRDDRILLSALTNPDALKPWMDAIVRHDVPVSGLYSLALLGPMLYEALQLEDDNVLLVLHDTAGLRQIFLQQGQIRFSRLTPLADHAPATIAAAATQETARTRQFLASTRLLARDGMLTVVTIAADAAQPALTQALAGMPAATHLFCSFEDAGRAWRLPSLGADSRAEHLFLHRVCKRSIPTHYVVPELARVFRLWQTRIALTALTGVVALVAVLWSAFDLQDAYQARQQVLQLRAETHAAEKRYNEINRSLPATEAHPHDMKSAVSVEEIIERNAPDPLHLMADISNALERVPRLQVNRIQWGATQSAPTENAPATPDGREPVGVAAMTPALGPGGLPSAAVLGIPAKPYQVVRIEGEVVGDGQDYRQAISAVQEFADRLANDKQLQVKVVKFPLDTRPTVRIEGAAAEEAERQRSTAFIVSLTRSP